MLQQRGIKWLKALNPSLRMLFNIDARRECSMANNSKNDRMLMQKKVRSKSLKTLLVGTVANWTRENLYKTHQYEKCTISSSWLFKPMCCLQPLQYIYIYTDEIPQDMRNDNYWSATEQQGEKQNQGYSLISNAVVCSLA